MMIVRWSHIITEQNDYIQSIPFYLQDENGDTYEFGWSLIYQYTDRLNSRIEDTNYKYVIIVDWWLF